MPAKEDNEEEENERAPPKKDAPADAGKRRVADESTKDPRPLNTMSRASAASGLQGIARSMAAAVDVDDDEEEEEERRCAAPPTARERAARKPAAAATRLLAARPQHARCILGCR